MICAERIQIVLNEQIYKHRNMSYNDIFKNKFFEIEKNILWIESSHKFLRNDKS